jgi:asparagine synthase (glutamine-hydrolysing)
LFNNKYAHLNRLLYFDVKTWLPCDLFLKNDKMTMAHGVEARVPFMDHNLVEFSATLPSALKMKHFKEKYIYRKAVQKILPKEILRRKKTGFTVPLKKWMGEGLKDYAHDVFMKSSHGLFNKEEMFKVLNNFDKSVFHKRQFYTLLMFELWHKSFIENEKL